MISTPDKTIRNILEANYARRLAVAWSKAKSNSKPHITIIQGLWIWIHPCGIQVKDPSLEKVFYLSKPYTQVLM